MDITWKIGGEAGFGIMTTGLSFSKICTRLGYHILDFVEYPSLIRGGHNAYEVRVSDEPVNGLKKTIDYLVCLNEETYNTHQHRLTPDSIVIYDATEFDFKDNFRKISVPFNKIINDLKGPLIVKNTIVLGASLAILGSNLDLLNQILQEQFTDKGEEIVKFNTQFAKAGFDHVKNNYAQLIKPVLENKFLEKKLVLNGNDAFALAAVIADCRLYAAYPMTPSTGVLTDLAAWQNTSGMIVRHAEDEIAVINTALGSSFAGVRSAIGTSGGGFALMTEAISFSGMAEIPLVIFLSQRPGPATGLPTLTEQGDLLFAVHAGHGEFPKIVLAPGDVAEMIEMSAQAFNLADKYQLPIIVLSDMYLSESHQSLSKKYIDDFISNFKINRGKIINQPNENNYLRYKDNVDGISEMLIPGATGYYYQANSYEHLENSHTTESALERKKQVEKRDKKSQTYLQQDFQMPKIYGDLAEAEIVLVSWGSTKGIILQAQKLLSQKSIKTAFIHFTYLYPLNKEKIIPLFNQGKRYVLLENNYSGQFGKLLTQETGIEIKEKILKYDGRQLSSKEIVDYFSK